MDSYYDLEWLDPCNASTNCSIEQSSFSYPEPFKYFIYTIYTLIFTSAIIGNALVVVVVFTQHKMRTTTNLLIANLAVGDLLLSCLCVPFGTFVLMEQYWPFGEVLCYVVFPCQSVFVFVSAYTLVGLAWERYDAILDPLRGRWGKRKCLWVLSLVWSGSIVVSIPVGVVVGVVKKGHDYCQELWTNETLRLSYTLSCIFLQYFLPIMVLIFTYSRIACHILLKKRNNPGSCAGVREMRLERAKRRTIYTTFLVVTLYTLAWLPLNLVYLYYETLYSPEEGQNGPLVFEYIFVISHVLAMSHCSVNPVIYAGLNIRFREGLMGVVHCWRRRR